MNKQLVVISGPVDTFSGYGARSRDIVKTLISSGKYDIKIMSQRWGSTPFGFLQEDNPEHKKIMDCILKTPQIDRQPDVWIQITVPNEMQKIGKYNILITAGIETTVCDPSWIDGCNRADLVIVSSNHAKQVFETSKFEERDQRTNQVFRKIELTTPVEVLFEGIDTNIYKKLDLLPNVEVKETLDSIKEEFCFLFVGHWLQGNFGADRKDIGGLVETFLRTFKDKQPRPALILKTNGASCSILDREEILSKINQIQQSLTGVLPNIYLLHGELSDNDINVLYNHPKVKTMVSFTKGEGFGRPLLEFTVSQKPVIASNWSGHKDFLSEDKSVLLGGQLKPLDQSAVVPNMLIQGSQWFNVDYKAASKTLEDVWKSYKKYLDLGKRQAYKSRTEFSLDKMGEKLMSILENKVPIHQEIKLPNMNNIKLPKIQAI
jgi:glycosyltransferase involved in cell wall biosynthesis